VFLQTQGTQVPHSCTHFSNGKTRELDFPRTRARHLVISRPLPFDFQEIQKRNTASESSISSTMEVIDPESSGLTNDVSGRLSFFTKGDDQGPKNEECASALATPSKVPPAAAMHMFCHVSMQQEYAYEYGVCMRIRTHSLTGPVMQSRAWGCCAYVGNAGVRT